MGDYSKGRRQSYSMEYEEEYEDSGLRLIRKSGIPLLYIVAVCANVVGIICIAIIAGYWANVEWPMCFLYAQTASNSPVYRFGGALSTCSWVAYGAIPVTIVMIACGVLYMFGVFGDPLDRDEEKQMVRYTGIIVVAMFAATILQLAVCATIAEGLRVTCTNMSLNKANGRNVGCLEKLDLRVRQYQLPVTTSTMVTAGQIGLWTGWTALVFLLICHCISLCRMR